MRHVAHPRHLANSSLSSRPVVSIFSVLLLFLLLFLFLLLDPIDGDGDGSRIVGRERESEKREESVRLDQRPV